MARDILSDPQETALVAAVRDVGRRSGAEVVVAFPDRSGSCHERTAAVVPDEVGR